MVFGKFEAAFCINLDRRPDRWARTQEVLSVCKVEVLRFPAVDCNGIDRASSRLAVGEIACAMSHAEVHRLALSMGLKSWAVFEDDVELSPGGLARIEAAMRELPANWDVIYFGCNHVTKPRPFTANLVIPTKAYTTSSYAVTAAFATQFLQRSSPRTMQVDVQYCKMQGPRKYFSVSPNAFYQRPGFSDVQGGDVDYRNEFSK